MRIVHTLSIVTALVLGAQTYASAGAGRSQQPADLTGTYSCRGQNFDGTSYEAIVEIVKHNDAYQVLWIIDDEVAALGMGVVQKDVLAVAYYAGAPGVVAYHVEGDGRLVGQWTLAGADGTVVSETLTRTADTTGRRAPPSSWPSGNQHPEMPVRRPAAKTRPA
jgi:hypothetical protein